METTQNLWRIDSKAQCSVHVVILPSRVSLQMTSRCFRHHMPGRSRGGLSPFCTRPLHWLASPSLASFCPKEVFESLSCALCSSQQLLPIHPTTSWTQGTLGAESPSVKEEGALATSSIRKVQKETFTLTLTQVLLSLKGN